MAHQTHAELSWVYTTADIAQDGHLHLGVLVISMAWVTLGLAGRLFNHSHNAPREPALSPWYWDVASIGGLMVATMELRDIPLLYNLNIMVGWSIMLRFARLWLSIDVQGMLLHQSTLIVWISMALLMAGSLLPCIDATAECLPDPGYMRAVASLATSALVTAFTPRQGTLPPKDVAIHDIYMSSNPSPEQTCSAFSWHITHSWIDSLVSKTCSQNGGLHRADIPPLPWYSEPLLMMREMREAREWGKSTLWALLWFSRRELVGIAVYTWISCVTENMAPYGLYRLLLYLSNPTEAVIRPWAWLALIFFGSVSTSILTNQHQLLGARFVMRTEAGCKLDLYQRAMDSMQLDGEEYLDKSNGTPSSTAAGRIANLMSSDIADVHCFSRAFHNLCRFPVGIGISLVALYHLVGWIALAGICVLVMGLPFSVWVASKAQKLAGATQDIRDARISVVGEYLSAIRAVKYFAWEDVAVARVDEVRQAEQDNQWGIIMVHVWPGQLSQFIPYVTLLAVFALYAIFSGHQLDAATGFTTMFLLAAVKKYADLVGSTVGELVKSILAFGRLDKFFSDTVLKEVYPVGPLNIHGASFRRSKGAQFVLRDVSISFAEGGLNVITGPSGSGKTTLLLAILGEAVKEEGQVTRPLNVAYASQTVWLQNKTIRDNILFQSEFEQERYETIIDACCLAIDLNGFPQRDMTLVGENGSALSGGQRARVALARALYSYAPLLLLDDIFSTLDAKTAARIWDKCFCGSLLEGRTTLLVTQIPWIASMGDVAVILRDGVIEQVERHVEVVRGSGVGASDNPLVGSDPQFSRYTQQTKKVSSKLSHSQEFTIAQHKEFKTAEKYSRLAFYRRYVSYFGPSAIGLFYFFMLFFAKSVQFIRSASLSTWVEAPNLDDDDKTSSEQVRDIMGDGKRLWGVLFYLGVYGFMSLLESVTDTTSRLCFSIGSWNAGRTLHHNLVNSVVHTDLSWFSSVPVGNVISRLSGDMNVIDHVWDWLFFTFVSQVVGLVFQFGAVAAMLPAFIVPITVAAAVGVVIGERYSMTATTLTRLVDTSQVPVYSHLSDSLSGLAVVRAREGMPLRFAEDLARSLREWSAAKQAQLSCHRWVSVRLDFISACVVLATGYIAVSRAGVVAAGLAGLSLSNARELNENLLSLVRSMNALETGYPSLERIEEYIALEPEDKHDNPYPQDEKSIIPPNWPVSGAIEFRNVTIRYDANGPNILSNINLKFKTGERVAIVGRTGAGKSTLVLAMLRFATVVAGKILYDGIDTSRVPRKRLREGLTIIPQEATLLKGTVAYNLDPTGKVPRERLQSALDQCREISCLGSAMADTDSSNAITLDTPVAPLGENFSHGQRQVLSLCRALVRDTRLMLLDEATASMDYETDRGIQSVLRTWVAQRGDATLVTIAHRLRTIIDYDTVVVMGDGRVLDVGPPREIYAARGAFYDMVQQSGEARDLEGLFGLNW